MHHTHILTYNHSKHSITLHCSVCEVFNLNSGCSMRTSCIVNVYWLSVHVHYISMRIVARVLLAVAGSLYSLWFINFDHKYVHLSTHTFGLCSVYTHTHTHTMYTCCSVVVQPECQQARMCKTLQPET